MGEVHEQEARDRKKTAAFILMEEAIEESDTD